MHPRMLVLRLPDRGRKIIIKCDTMLLVKTIAHRRKIDICRMHRPAKPDCLYLSSQIFDADGNLRSFELAMIAVVTLTIVGR
jgi:hypothetical protein